MKRFISGALALCAALFSAAPALATPTSVAAALAPATLSAAGGALKSDLVQPRVRICSAFSGANLLPLTPAQSNGTTQLSGTDRLFWTPNTDCKNPRFLMANGQMTTGGIFVPNGNAVTFFLTAEVRFTATPVSFRANTGSPISTTTYSVSSLSGSGTTVTATTATANLPTTGTVFPVTISGATPSGYNGTYSATVTGSTTFTYAGTTTGASSGTITAVTQGRTGTTISDGAIIMSDPVPTGVLTSGSTQAIRIHKVVSAGQHWPYNYGSGAYTYNVYRTTDAVYGSTVTDGSDQTYQYGNQTWGSFQSTSYQWVPTAILAEQVTPKPVVLNYGDSIAAGLNGKYRGFGYLGYAEQAAGVPWYSAGVDSSRADTACVYGSLSAILSSGADYVEINIGINDIRNTAVPDLATFQASIIGCVKAVAQPWSRIRLNTMVPLTTSTNNWSDYAGQTPLSGVSGTGSIYTREQMRVVANNWERDPGPNGAVQMIQAQLTNGAKMLPTSDVASAVERNSDGSAVVLDASGQQTLGTGGRWVVAPVTCTAALTAATSCTMTAPWPWATGTTLVKFSDASQQTGTLTNGSTTVTWSTPVTATASITTPNFAVTDGIHPIDMVYPAMAAKMNTAAWVLPLQ